MEEGIMESTINYTVTAVHSQKRTAVWTGRVISAFAVLFMLFDCLTKITQNPYVMKASANLGYPAAMIPVVGIILLACVVVYVIPRTSIIGAILLTGYLGGAVASNMRIGTPLFSNILFLVYFGILVWAGLYLRNHRVRELFSLRKVE
jgi:hypothetical protein